MFAEACEASPVAYKRVFLYGVSAHGMTCQPSHTQPPTITATSASIMYAYLQDKHEGNRVYHVPNEILVIC